MPDLLVIVPSRGRPTTLARTIEAWDATNAWPDADLLYVLDEDDPTHEGYGVPGTTPAGNVRVAVNQDWLPLVPKLNNAALQYVYEYRAIGFMGDDNAPRTVGWAARYVEALTEMGTGIVYGDDGLQGERLPTQWAMTTDIIRTLGAMVPAEVQHLYCDNVIRDLGQAAGCIRYLPDVLIEHLHPAAGKAPMDAGYKRWNSPVRFAQDRGLYKTYLATRFVSDVEKLKAVMVCATP